MENQLQTEGTENAPKQDVAKPEVVSSNTPQSATLPQVQHSPFKKYLKILVFALIAVLVVGVVVAGYFIIVIVGGLHSIASSCSKGRTQLFSQTKTITDEFNSIAFISGQDDVKAQVTKQEGDCVDSLPTISATRDFKVATSAGAAFDAMSKALTENGYTTVKSTPYKDDFPKLNPCSFKDNQYSYEKGDHKIDIALTCASYGAKGEDWRQVPATNATAYLDVAWTDPQE